MPACTMRVASGSKVGIPSNRPARASVAVRASASEASGGVARAARKQQQQQLAQRCASLGAAALLVLGNAAPAFALDFNGMTGESEGVRVCACV